MMPPMLLIEAINRSPLRKAFHIDDRGRWEVENVGGRLLCTDAPSKPHIGAQHYEPTLCPRDDWQPVNA